MNEDQYKRIIKKSSIETSEDFVNDLMRAIEEREHTKSLILGRYYRTILTICTVLVLIMTYLLFKVLSLDYGTLNTWLGNYKTPIFMIVSALLLYGLNNVVKLNNKFKSSN